MTVFLPEIFPYQFFSGFYYPIITAFIHTGNSQLPKSKILALVDSGASMSIFQADMATELGIKIETGKPTNLQGVGGTITGYIHNLIIDVARKTVECPVVFSAEYKVSVNLLGRKGFFDAFQITFNESKKQLSLL